MQSRGYQRFQDRGEKVGRELQEHGNWRMDTEISLSSQAAEEEEKESCSLPFVANGDDLTVRQFVGLFKGRGLSGSLHFLLKVESDVTELFLDITDNFTLSSGGEGVTALDEDADEVFSQVTTGHVETENSVWEGITFVDGDSVGDTITRVEDDTGGTTGSVEGKDGLDGDVESGGVEGFKHDLGHLLAVRLGVQGSFGQENGVFLGGNTEFIVEGVVPDLLHIVPVGHDTVFNGVTESKDTSLGLSLVTHVGVLLTHTDHDAGVARTADNGWEDLTHAKCQNSCFFCLVSMENRGPPARGKRES